MLPSTGRSILRGRCPGKVRVIVTVSYSHLMYQAYGLLPAASALNVEEDGAEDDKPSDDVLE